MQVFPGWRAGSHAAVWLASALACAACGNVTETKVATGHGGSGTPRAASSSNASADGGSPGDAAAASGKGGETAPSGSGGAAAQASTAGRGTGASGGMAMREPDAAAGGAAAVLDAGKVGEPDAAADATVHVFHPSCLDGITDYENPGPFSFQPQTSGELKLWVPALPDGCKVPIIHMAAGTGATCDPYAPTLERLASHGFLAICYNNPSAVAGDLSTAPFEIALAALPAIADLSFGTTGHETGGQTAVTMLQHAEEKWGDRAVYAGLAMEPASGAGAQLEGGTWQEVYAKLRAPMFVWSALGTDGIVSQAWVQQAYDALSPTEEAYFWTADGAKHIPVPNAEEEEIAIPWFRWKLLGDAKACEFLKAIPRMDPRWAEVASKNTQPCR